MIAAAFGEQAGALSVEYAVRDAEKLLLAAETHAIMLAELGQIDLPAAARAEPMQLRAVASLYLASTLEAAGLIQAADDFTRMVRGGMIQGDLGDAMNQVVRFWETRNDRAGEDERLALFGRLFGAPVGPVDLAGGVNLAFEERLLDLCEAIVGAADGASTSRTRMMAQRVAENLGDAANDMILMMARDIVGSLSQAIAILNHPRVRAVLAARTMWDAVGAIDRRLRRAARPTLSHLRRGRAGMVVLAWLADFVERMDRGGGIMIGANDPVLGAALDWVDETIALIQAEAGNAPVPGTMPGQQPSAGSWLDLGR